MNPKLTRREVLKTGAILAAATAASGLYSWHVPGGPPQVILPGEDDHSDPATIPLDVTEVEMTFGSVVAAGPSAMAENSDLPKIAYNYCRRAIRPELIAGWAPVELLREAEIETKPGGGHYDPLSENWLFGVKQVWKMQRL